MAETLENYSFFDKGIFHILQDALHSGCDDAQNGRMAGLPGDPPLFQNSDHHAYSKGRRAG